MSNSIMPNAMNTGVRRLHTLGGWGLGAVSDIGSQMIVEHYDRSVINALISTPGITDAMLQNLWDNTAAGSQEFADAAVQLLQNLRAAQAPAVSPSPSSGNVLRGGSQLSYTATWGNDFSSWNDPNAIQSSIQSVLAMQWGIVIDNQFHTTSDIINFSGQSGFTLQVHTTRDYGSAGDVKSIIDGALYNLGVSLKSSTISLTVTGMTPLVTGIPGAPGVPAGTPNVPVTNWSAWLQQNMGLLVFGLAAIVIVPPLLKRR